MLTQHALARERLLDEIERALLVASTAVLIVPWPEIDHDRQRLVHRAQPLEHLEAVHARHLDVEQHEVGRLALGQREPFLARSRRR